MTLKCPHFPVWGLESIWLFEWNWSSMSGNEPICQINKLPTYRHKPSYCDVGGGIFPQGVKSQYDGLKGGSDGVER